MMVGWDENKMLIIVKLLYVHLHEGISAFSVWTQCGLISPQGLANFAEIRFRSAMVPG
jgi:hypothetical protein